uniref:Uncharacterized protein n=1 Tax=Plectus sambesii TaxID=2011161 RepID=A0A914VY46_9BILA
RIAKVVLLVVRHAPFDSSNIAAAMSEFRRGRIADGRRAIRIAQGRALRRPWESPGKDRSGDTRRQMVVEGRWHVRTQ